MNCPNCLETRKIKITRYTDMEKLLRLHCLQCGADNPIKLDVVIDSFNELKLLEGATNELHFFICNHPTLQRLCAINEQFDTLLINVENRLDLENNYERQTATTEPAT